MDNQEASSLLELFHKYDAVVRRHEAAELRHQEKAAKARQARDGFKAALEIEGRWQDTSMVSSSTGPIDSTSSRGTLTPIIRRVLPTIEGDITLHAVIEAVNAIEPNTVEPGKESSVSSALRRLTKDEGLLVVKHKGGGKRATKYQYVGRNGHDAQPLSDTHHQPEGGEDDT